jgi:hypothetical protein
MGIGRQRFFHLPNLSPINRPKNAAPLVRLPVEEPRFYNTSGQLTAALELHFTRR